MKVMPLWILVGFIAGGVIFNRCEKTVLTREDMVIRDYRLCLNSGKTGGDCKPMLRGYTWDSSK